jgi:hypothetical protein
MQGFTEEEKKTVIDAALELGFVQNPDGSFTATPEQLFDFSLGIAAAIIEQVKYPIQ